MQHNSGKCPQRQAHRFIRAVTSLLLALCVPSGSVTPLVADESSNAVPEIVPVVLMAPSGPLIIHLEVTVGRASWRYWMADRLVRTLDQDADDMISATEQRMIPRQLRELMSGDARSVDKNEAAAPIPRDEVTAEIQRLLPEIPQLTTPNSNADQAVRLFTLLDNDYSGTLTMQELRQASRQLRFRDLDDDDTFSASELTTYRDPRSATSELAPEAISLPFHHLVDPQSRRDAATRIMRQYGSGETLAVDQLRTSASQPLPAVVSIEELSHMLPEMTPHMRARIRLSDAANRSTLSCVVSPHAAEFCFVEQTETMDSAILKTEGLRVRLSAYGGGINSRANTRGRLGQEFMMQDSDRSQGLSESEFAAMTAALQQTGLNVSFADADSDADEQVTRKELFGLADREYAVVSGRLEFTVEQSGRTLFSMLDTNSDLRLTRREFLAAADALRQVDEDRNNVISDTELGIEYQLTVSLGRTELSRRTMNSMNQMESTGDALIPEASELSGPDWFRAMDRNKDGDVSIREFPGQIDVFRRLDQNADGLLNAQEAAAASIR